MDSLYSCHACFMITLPLGGCAPGDQETVYTLGIAAPFYLLICSIHPA